MRPPDRRTLTIIACALFIAGFVGGGVVGAIAKLTAGRVRVQARLPHHVPPTPDATPFRFAMVHDVIHERYARPGPGYYRERERLAREKLAVLHPDSETAYALTDDLAVSLYRTGRIKEAISLIRDKLKRQEVIGLTGKDLYSSYANLGEFLVQEHLWAMLGGDGAARERVSEGRALMKKSVDVNPTAHFGRQEWQLVAVDALLEAGTGTSRLRQCDLIGNRVDLTIEVPSGTPHPSENYDAVMGRPFSMYFPEEIRPGQPNDYSNEVIDKDRRANIRQGISTVGGESNPRNGDKRCGRRVPFDEPAMWLIGEWRQGAGPDPHLALCLGEIMLRVGQRYLAWNSYERAARMAEQFSPKADLQVFLRDHCKSRQAAIEKSIKPDEAAGLRSKFDAELDFGESYQRDYQAYADEKIAAGRNLDDPHFFDEFHAGRPPIASKVGPEEWYVATGPNYGGRGVGNAFLSWGLLTGGVCVFLMALIVRLRARPSPLHVTEVTPPP